MVKKSKSPKHNYQIVLAGVGGQGIIYLNRVIAKATMDLGYKVYCLEEHGMARRGGSVASFVRFGSEIYTPVIPQGTADLLIGFEVIESVRWLGALKDDAMVVLNPHIIQPFITKGEYPSKGKLLKYLGERYKGRQLLVVDAEAIAAELGSTITTNMVLLGAVASTGVLGIKRSSFISAIKKTSLPRYLKTNVEAFERGFNSL